MPTARSRHYRVSLAEVFAAHNRALQFGGRSGIRDQTLIESAVGRPYSGYYRSISRKAAAIVHSLALNHGFVDGNKRTALYTVNLLLEKSGYRLRLRSRRLRDREIERVILSIVEHRMSFEELVEWFKRRIAPIE